MSSPYYDDPEVKAQIDEILHENVKMFQNLGTGSSAEERSEVRAAERENLIKVKHLDDEFISFLLNASD